MKGIGKQFGIVLSAFFMASSITSQTSLAQDELGDPVQISAPQVVFGDVASFQVSPDNSRVVYIADQRIDGVNELFSVPIAGGSAVRLNDNLPTDGNVDGFLISPDGSRVVYFADQNTDEVDELFSVSITGGLPIRLNPNLVSGGDVLGNVFSTGFEISPDGSRVIYIAYQNINDRFELFSVPIGGGNTERLNDDLAEGLVDMGVVEFRISPDSSRVIYTADQNDQNSAGDELELFSVPISGGTTTRLNADLPTGGNVVDSSPLISADSSRVIYIADQNTVGVPELFSVPIAGGEPVPLNSNLVSGGEVTPFGHQISPDGSRVIYIADQNTVGVRELFSVPIAGGDVVRLNSNLVSGGEVSPFGVQISPDGSRVIYRADQNINNRFELFSVPITGGVLPERLNENLVSSGQVIGFGISPDASRVIYLADQNINNVRELFSVPIAGGTAIRLNDTLVSGGTVLNFRISPDSSRVIYLAEQNIDNISELFSVPITGGSVERVNDQLPFNAEIINNFGFSPDGRFIVYVGEQDVLGERELFSVEIPEPEPEDNDFCFPIVASNGNVAVVCL